MVRTSQNREGFYWRTKEGDCESKTKTRPNGTEAYACDTPRSGAGNGCDGKRIQNTKPSLNDTDYSLS